MQLERIRTTLLFGLPACVATILGCSSPRQNARTIQAQEVSAVQRATQKYDRYVKNIAVSGSTLIVSVDDQEWDALDTDVQDAIRESALRAWATAWQRYHPHRKALLRVSVRGYFGAQLGSAATML
jgi:TRAP-type C4-dicarboxylate transport system substrate-binding protein